MERISKLVEKALQERLNTETGSSGVTAETVGRGVALAELPIDPFPCPACGQMLAPSCRVCVACKHAIDPAEIIRALALALASSPPATSKATAERVPYPWPILFAVLGTAATVLRHRLQWVFPSPQNGFLLHQRPPEPGGLFWGQLLLCSMLMFLILMTDWQRWALMTWAKRESAHHAVKE